MVVEKMSRWEAVTVGKDNVVRSRGADNIVKHYIFPPPIIFMPEVSDGKERCLPCLFNHLLHFRARSVIGDEEFELPEGLALQCCQSEEERAGMIIDSEADREFWCHLVLGSLLP